METKTVYAMETEKFRQEHSVPAVIKDTAPRYAAVIEHIIDSLAHAVQNGLVGADEADLRARAALKLYATASAEVRGAIEERFGVAHLPVIGDVSTLSLERAD